MECFYCGTENTKITLPRSHDLVQTAQSIKAWHLITIMLCPTTKMVVFIAYELPTICFSLWLRILPVLVLLVGLLAEQVVLTPLEMFLSCSSMLLTSLLTCIPTSSATCRRSNRLCWSCHTDGPTDIETKAKS